MSKCPVCESDAQLERNADILTVACDHCGTYKASGSIIDFDPAGGPSILAKKDRDERIAALNRAKAAAKSGDLPVIHSYDL